MKLRFYISLLLVIPIIYGCGPKAQNGSLKNPAGVDSQFPSLYSSGNALYVSWITGHKDSNYSLAYARYADETWSKPDTIASDSTWFVNWADFPSIIADKKGPVAAHWLNKKTGGTYAYDVNISIADVNNQWSSAITPHRDSTATEHGFVSMIPWDKQSFLVVWLDGRRTENRADEEYYDLSKAMTLRGALITKNGKLQNQFLIDKSVCDCCQTSLVKTKAGAIVAYRNRTEEEIRDIYISRFDGSKWSNPQAVYDDGWKIGACPVNGPTIAASDSMVVTAWHTAAENPTVKAAISTDGGASFSDPVAINENHALGRVDAVIYNGKAYVSWMEKADISQLQVAAIDRNARILDRKTVSEINSSRQTGFPQMESLDNQLIFAWTETDSLSSTVKTRSMSLPF